MEALDTIDKRFSARYYLEKKVEWNKVATLLDAAIKAPSSGNLQNFRFIIVTDENKKREVAEACLKQTWITEAPILIIVCADLSNIKKYYNNRAEFYSIQNCAAATENILLAATDLNLGSCWVSAFDDEKLSDVLRLPAEVKPQSVIPIGYTNEKYPVKKRYELKTFIHYDEWGGKKDISLFPIKEGRLKDLTPEVKKVKKTKDFFNKIKKKISKKDL